MENVMNDKNTARIHWSFWVISIIMLIWNVMGSMNFVVQMINAEMFASMSETHRAIIEGRPLWATGGFAIAVFGGALGCLLLLFKKSSAYYLFIASLLGVVVTMFHSLSIDINFAPSDLTMMVIMPFVVAVFLIWYAMMADKKGWVF